MATGESAPVCGKLTLELDEDKKLDGDGFDFQVKKILYVNQLAGVVGRAHTVHFEEKTHTVKRPVRVSLWNGTGMDVRV